MLAIASLISLFGKILKFGAAAIALVLLIRSDVSFWPGAGLFILVTLVLTGIGFLIEVVGMALFVAHSDKY